MTINDLTNPELGVNSQVALVVYIAMMAVTGVVLNYGARFGYRGSKWALRRTREFVRPTPLTERAAAVLDLLAPTGDPTVWSTGDLPRTASRKVGNGDLKIARCEHAVDSTIACIGQRDLLYGLSPRERKTVFLRVNALLDELTGADAASKVAVRKPSLADEMLAGGQAKGPSASVARAQPAVNRDDYPGNWWTIASETVLDVPVCGYRGNVLGVVGRPLRGSAASGFDAYVPLVVSAYVKTWVLVAESLTTEETRTITAKSGQSTLMLAFLPTGTNPVRVVG